MYGLKRAGRALALVGGLALLAGCFGDKTPPRPASFREGGMISSVAIFDPARWAGDWTVVRSTLPGCSGARQHWAQAAGGWTVEGTDCGGAKPRKLDEFLALTGPGARITPQKSFNGEPVWLLWADADYRVAAIGTPSGSWGMILARDGMDRPDLMRAAYEVLDFAGYRSDAIVR